MSDTVRLSDLNAGVWRQDRLVGAYEDRHLSPAEIVLLLRHAGPLSGRVLELGPGAGRVTEYLAELATELTALEISPAMAEACRRHVPSATVQVRDMQDLGDLAEGALDAAVATNNVIDVLDHDERLALLLQLHRVLARGGLLLFSSHNRDGHARRPWEPRDWRRPRALAGDLLRLRESMRNHRRLKPMERELGDYALRNDEAHAFSLLHYNITAPVQRRQLAEAGFVLQSCMTDDAEPVDVSGPPSGAPYLHYAATAGDPGPGQPSP